MANLKTHCEDCSKELGEEFRYVHEWLDELLKYVGPDHRGYKHYRKGVEEMRRRWGDKAHELRRFISEEMKKRDLFKYNEGQGSKARVGRPALLGATLSPPVCPLPLTP
jgi:hypothetical protein